MSLRRGWKRIAVDQIKHYTNRARILKLVYRASGGGTFYVVSFKDKKDTWCRAPGQHPDLDDAYDLAARLIKENK